MLDQSLPGPGDVLRGWHFVESGKIKLGDKFWRFGNGSWHDVKDRHTFLGEDVEEKHWIKVIRKDGQDGQDGPDGPDRLSKLKENKL